MLQFLEFYFFLPFIKIIGTAIFRIFILKLSVFAKLMLLESMFFILEFNS